MADDDGQTLGAGDESDAGERGDVSFAGGRDRWARKPRSGWRREVDFDRCGKDSKL